jgi:transcription initiation factor IIE alpha subunit
VVSKTKGRQGVPTLDSLLEMRVFGDKEYEGLSQVSIQEVRSIEVKL